MANNVALGFFRGANAPANPVKGMIWFNTALNVIEVYNGENKWEQYGKVADVTFDKLKLNVKKSDGTEFTLDFSDVASANGVNATFADLKTRLAGMDTRMDGMDTRMNGIDTTITNLNTTLTSAIGDVNDKVNALDEKVGNLPTETTAKNVVEYVDLKVTAASDAATEDLSKEIKELEESLAAEAETARAAEAANAAAAAAAQAAADAAQKTIDDFLTKEGIDPNAVDSLKDIVAYMEEHGDQYEAIVESFNDLSSTVNTNKADIEKKLANEKAAIIKEIEDNEAVHAAAYTDLDEREKALAGRADALEGRATAVEGRVSDLEAIDADARLDAVETAVSTTLPAAITDAVNALNSEYSAGTAEAGKVAVVTGIEIEKGKIVEGEGKATGKVDVYTVAKIDELFNNAIGNGGSVSTQINNAIAALDLPNTYDAKGAADDALEAANAYTDEKLGVYASEGVEATGVRAEIAARDAQVLSAAETYAKDYADGLDSAMNTRVEALETAVETTLPAAIATAKSEAITAAGQAADQKIADLKLDETYEKVGVAETKVNALANGAVKDNTDAIAALKNNLEAGAGMYWASFE